MPLPAPKAARPARPPATRPLAERLARWHADHDPGGIDTTRALHLALSFILVIVTGYAIARGFDLGAAMETTFPLMAGVGVMAMISFTPAANRRAEAGNMALLFLISSGFLGLLALVGPGEGPDNAIAQKLLLIPLSFFALALRRWGMAGQRLGLALIVVATVGTIISPTHREALLLLAAFCQGALVAALVRLSPWRPSAVTAYVCTTLDMQRAVAAYLREMSDAVRRDRPLGEETVATMEALRTRVWNAIGNASAEAPGAQVAFETRRATYYRLRVAVELLASCIPEDDGPSSPWRVPFAACVDDLARRLERADVADPESRTHFSRALDTLRAEAFSPRLPAKVRFALLLSLTAFARLALILDTIAGLEDLTAAARRSARGTGPAGPKPTPLLTRTAEARLGLGAPLKVALQGVVATSLTTALDLFVGLDHAYWATMTVMFVLGNSLGETYVRVRYRTFGTLIGVAVGIGAFLALGHEIWLLATFCMAAMMLALVTMKDRYDIASAAIGFAVVLGLHIIAGLGAEGMLARIYETAIGAGVALVASTVVLPVYLANQVRQELRATLRRGRDIFATWWPHPGAPESIGPLAGEVRALDLRLPQIGAERLFGHSAGDMVNVVSTLDVIVTYLALLEDTAGHLSTIATQTGVKAEVVAALDAARGRTLAAFDLIFAQGDDGKDGNGNAESAQAEADAAATVPVLEAAVATVIALADDPKVKGALPAVADYLAYSQALLRPLRELRAAVRDQTPWRWERAIAAGRPMMRLR